MARRTATERRKRRPARDDDESAPIWHRRVRLVADIVTICGFVFLLPSLMVALIGANVIRNPFDPSFNLTLEDTLSVELPCIEQETVRISIDEVSAKQTGLYGQVVRFSRHLAQALGSPAADVPSSSFEVITILPSKPTERVTIKLPEPGTYHYLVTGQARLMDGHLIYELGEDDRYFSNDVNTVYFVDSGYRCGQPPDPATRFPLTLKTPADEKVAPTPHPAQ